MLVQSPWHNIYSMSVVFFEHLTEFLKLSKKIISKNVVSAFFMGVNYGGESGLLEFDMDDFITITFCLLLVAAAIVYD